MNRCASNIIYHPDIAVQHPTATNTRVSRSLTHDVHIISAHINIIWPCLSVSGVTPHRQIIFTRRWSLLTQNENQNKQEMEKKMRKLHWVENIIFLLSSGARMLYCFSHDPVRGLRSAIMYFRFLISPICWFTYLSSPLSSSPNRERAADAR